MPDVLRPSGPCLPHVAELEPGEFRRWCGCGRSAILPWCEGRESRCGERSRGFAVERPRIVWLCSCLRTDNPPYCDGSHSLHEDAP